MYITFVYIEINIYDCNVQQLPVTILKAYYYFYIKVRNGTISEAGSSRILLTNSNADLDMTAMERNSGLGLIRKLQYIYIFNQG